ncbi:hypothetical protein IAR55_006622 [Kwoniella newhampshirensis]|uniref:Uncharacterized protein n=1 Tax=Kwoniella newhampshirensis TaxID=1651941 RepID=A0AAW0YRL2_9TREE
MSSALSTPSPPAGNYVPAHPTDEDMFKRRYVALQEIIHELEDENNLIAYRIAKLRKQAQLEAIEKEKERKRALKRAARARARARDALIAEEKEKARLQEEEEEMRFREEEEKEERERERESERERLDEGGQGSGRVAMGLGAGTIGGRGERVLRASYLDDEEEGNGQIRSRPHLNIGSSRITHPPSLSPLLNNPSSDAHAPFDGYARQDSYHRSPTKRSDGDVSMEDDY